MQAQGRFWSVTLAAVLAVGVTASLGRWQMDRAAQKQALQTAVETRATQSPLTSHEAVQALRPGAEQAADLLHRTVHLRGRWLAEHTVYLDNRQMNGRPGFFVLTPLQLEGAAHSVLVQRGWIARNFQDRTAPSSTLRPRSSRRCCCRVCTAKRCSGASRVVGTRSGTAAPSLNCWRSR